MKVLHVLNTGKYSGAENVVITLIHALDGKVECAYASPDGPIREILKSEKISFFPISTVATNAKELKQIIQEYRPDIIHTHDYNAGIMACLTGTKVPIINHLHNNTPWLKKICVKSLAYFVSCAKYKKILTVSDAVMDEYIFGRVLKKKATVVKNPVNVKYIQEKSKEKNILCDESDIIFLGRLSAQKNPIFFLEIVSNLKRHIPTIKVAMVGTGEMRDEVERKIKSLKLEENVVLYGFQKNPYGLLEKSKILCMPSLWEGYGLAAVEGLAMGKPVIASPVGGLKNIITKDCGELCESLDEYTTVLLQLLENQSLYDAKSANAITRAQSIDNIFEYTENIYHIYNTIRRK